MNTLMTLVVHYKGQTCTVTGRYTAATPDVMYLSNGDPGHPGDPEEFDFDTISADDGEPPPDPLDDDDFYTLVLEAAEEELGKINDRCHDDFFEAREEQ
jgi:hypothetical protein